MRSHLRISHPNEFLSLNPKTTSFVSTTPKVDKVQEPTKFPASDQPRITNLLERRTPYAKDSRRQKAITDKLTLMIAKLMLPFSIVDEPEFRDFVGELDQRYTVPSRKYISDVAIPSKYNEVKARVLGDLKQAKHVSCTTDGWTSHTMDPYLSLTVHFITPSWQLKTYCLRTIYMPESHTGQNVSQMITNILREYDIHLIDVTSITTDSGANMVKACDDLEVVRVPCFGHILHNAINTSIKDPKLVEAIKGVRSIVTTFSHSGR